MHWIRPISRALSFVLVTTAVATGANASPASPPAGTTLTADSIYTANHPSLLFAPNEIPALRTRIGDGGFDDDAYAAIEDLVHGVYPFYPQLGETGPGYGLETLPNLGLVGFISSPTDTAALEVGRALTNLIAQQTAPDYDEANSALRLRALALGYDLFFATADETERAAIRTEIESYLSLVTTTVAYELFEYPPYLANHSAMLAAALGIAAICVWEEGDPALVADALAMADRICDGLIDGMIDERGCYAEGVFYALWTMKHLVYYFEARRRFDGYDYAGLTRVRALEEWLAYELLPVGQARSLNLGDSAFYSRPLALYPTYFAWAMSRWSSGLSAWMWDRSAGTYGVQMGEQSDRAGTVLWWRSLPQVSPSAVLPPRQLFPGRGLYLFRTGWQQSAHSDDILFAFYSGPFHGGHAQEDQNQFVLHAYGAQLVVDHGPGSSVARQSEAHNMVFIDGAGQHNAGSSIGTDGAIVEYLLGGFADYVVGDATEAYGTHSPLNDPDHPIDGIDWSWGYSGANPVEYALRRVLAVDDGVEPPYFVVMDDVRKDGGTHDFEWRLHTSDSNTVDVSGFPVTIQAPGAALAIHVLRPDPATLGVSTAAFSNGTPEANSTLLRFTHNAVDPGFVFLLLPTSTTTPQPSITPGRHTWGVSCQVDFGDGAVDVFLRNDSGSGVTRAGISTDAHVLVLRRRAGQVERYLATRMTSLTAGGTLYAEFNDSAASCELAADAIHIDRYDAACRFLDTGVTALRYRDQEFELVPDGNGYLVADPATGVRAGAPARPAASLRAWPNPFNPSVTLQLRAPAGERFRVEIFDVAGRRVLTLWEGSVPAGVVSLSWDGRNDRGTLVSSGTYFALARSATARAVTRLTLVK